MSSPQSRQERTPTIHPADQRQVTLQITTRAVLVGLVLVLVIAVWVPYATYILHGSRMTLSHMSVGALILFFLVAFGVQLPLQRLRPAWAFSSGELLVIFAMMLMASTIPGKAFSSYFLGLLAAPHYYAAPENQWVESFFAYLPDWLVVGNLHRAADWFYEGLPPNGSIPWGDWIIPLFWWMLFLAALFLVTSCSAVIFRRQWVEHERLAFPLVRIPMEIIEQVGGSGGLPAFMRQRNFWIGFGVVAFILLWNCVSFFDTLPPIPIGANFRTTIVLGEAFPPITAQLNLFAICFAFFADLNVLFSIWFFYLLAVLEIGILNRLGLSMSGGAVGANWAVKAQHFGGFVLFVLWGLWIARHHLQVVFWKAVGRRPEVDDSDELISYRKTLLGLALGLTYMVFWLHRTGMSFVLIALLIPLTLLLYIGVTRIVAETGMVFLDLPVNSNQFTVVAVGSDNLSPANLTALGLSHAISHNHRGFGMSSLIHSNRAADQVARRKGGLFAVLCLTMAVTFVSTMIYTVHAGYTGIGAHQFGPMNQSVGFFDEIVRWRNNPTTLSHVELYFLGIGAGITALLLFLHHRLPWWPFHPIGYTIAYAEIIVIEVVSIFFIWLVKWVLLRVGGIDLFRKTRPLFIGALLGYALGVGVSFLVDLIWFPGQGHGVHNW